MSNRYSPCGWALAAGTALILSACGGGGSSSATESAAARTTASTRSVAVPAQADRSERNATPAAAGRLYIVQLAEAPVLAYQGEIAGYRATKPAKGSKINPNSPQVSSYVGYLTSRHDRVLAAAGGGRKAHSYGYTFNGFAAELSDAQAAKLAMTPGVLAVARDERRSVDTSSTPSFLGLDAAGGLWQRLGGPVAANGPNSGGAGEGIVIGIVDSGVWPEHPSFSDRDSSGKLVYQQLPGWHGKCVPGEAFNASHCNQKLIGARFYNEGFGGNAGIDADLPFEFNSPRDHNGHGTHTASTAGGNHAVRIPGEYAPFGAISGIAPRARIAVYKACWSVPGTAGSCTGVDLLAAIDQAVADGVDVINYSISGSRTNFRDPVEIAFLSAADAGVFVAASAGNAGPTISTVAHPSPWITTVAAGTHPRAVQGVTLTLGNGAVYSGGSVVLSTTPGTLIDAAVIGKAGAAVADAERCFPGTLDPAKAAGKIVLCKRGAIALVDKTDEVQAAGGIGSVLYNDSAAGSATDTPAIAHAVPTIHVNAADGLAIRAYVATAGANASGTINGGVVDNAALPAPLTASFSSRGPLLAGGGDLLKPDLIAPGQDIMAAVAPPNNGGRLFDLYSGTSMSSPHVAGLGALFKQLHPTWSPMAIKSALMTSAGDVLDGGSPAPSTNPILIFRQGAGHVRPNSAADPGLVFDSSFADWLGFLCGTQLPTSFCTSAGVPVLDPSNLNTPSIAIGDLAGTQTVTRRVTNVGNATATYNASVAGMAGFAVEVSPASLTLARGETKSFSVKFTRTAAALTTYTGGQLTLADATHRVRVPVVVRPVALAAPAQVSGTYSVTFGYDGPFSATPRGLVPAALSNGAVADDPTNGDCSLTAPNAQVIDVPVPAGTTYARFALFDADVAAGSDIDLCVFSGATLVGASASGTSAEEVNIAAPAAGTYRVVVHGWEVPSSSAFKLHTWLLGSSAAGNMTVAAPATAVTGTTGTVTLGFSGLAAGTKYLGSVAYGGVGGLPAPTIVRVDQP